MQTMVCMTIGEVYMGFPLLRDAAICYVHAHNKTNIELWEDKNISNISLSAIIAEGFKSALDQKISCKADDIAIVANIMWLLELTRFK
jgi:hypothetical protein